LKASKYDIILIGGSAGSISVIIQVLNHLPEQLKLPIVIIIHRMRNVNSEMDALLSAQARGKKITEPEDKTTIQPATIYLAPQNYHMLFETKNTFSLDYSEAVNFSRPSIDVSFQSAAATFGGRCLAVLLSGANKDGAAGIHDIITAGGTALIQQPSTAEYQAMPTEAIKLNPNAKILTPAEIVHYLRTLNT